MREHDNSPLLPQVKEILTKKGYEPVEGSGLFVKAGPSLIGRFVQVTRDGVQPFGVVPRPPKESHLAFVARNARYLFK